MPKFIPETSLLNNVYVPQHVEPKPAILTNDNLTIIGNVISLGEAKPFIRYEWFDHSRREWSWCDASGFPYRFSYGEEVDALKRKHFTGWHCEGVWGTFRARNIETLNEYPTATYDKSDELYFGQMVDLSATINTSGSVWEAGTLRLYLRTPLVVVVDGMMLSDKTNWATFAKGGPLEDNEYRYDRSQNTIELGAGYADQQVSVGFYQAHNEVSVKCRMAANEPHVSHVSPVVDYYIVKLSGQD